MQSFNITIPEREETMSKLLDSQAGHIILVSICASQSPFASLNCVNDPDIQSMQQITTRTISPSIPESEKQTLLEVDLPA